MIFVRKVRIRENAGYNGKNEAGRVRRERGLILLYRESCFGRALFAMKGSVYTLIRA